MAMAILVPNEPTEVETRPDEARREYSTPQLGQAYDAYAPRLDAQSGRVAAASSGRPIVEVVAGDTVILDTAAMEPGRPYTYRLGGHWLAAIRRPDEKIDFFAIR